MRSIKGDETRWGPRTISRIAEITAMRFPWVSRSGGMTESFGCGYLSQGQLKYLEYVVRHGTSEGTFLIQWGFRVSELAKLKRHFLDVFLFSGLCFG